MPFKTFEPIILECRSLLLTNDARLVLARAPSLAQLRDPNYLTHFGYPGTRVSRGIIKQVRKCLGASFALVVFPEIAKLHLDNTLSDTFNGVPIDARHSDGK